MMELSCVRRRGIWGRAGLRSVALLLLVVLPWEVRGWAEFCSGSNVHTVSQAECPGGLLFTQPQSFDKCIFPPPEERDNLGSLCAPDQDIAATSKIQFIDVGADDANGPSDGAYATASCKATCQGEYASFTKTNTRSVSDGVEGAAGADGADGEAMSEEDTSGGEPPTTSDPLLYNQTLRLFMYMTGHLLDENDGGPNLRVVDILRLSSKVVRKHMGAEFVSEDFLQSMERAFLFVLREGGVGRVKDVGRDEGKEIKKVLDACMSGADWVRPIKLAGAACRTGTRVKSIAKKTESGMEDVERKYPLAKGAGDGGGATGGWRWGHTDVVVESMWALADFVHAMCYPGFNLNVNNHHLYQRAMERLFTPEVLYRWQNPVKLAQEFYWDHVFMSNVKVGMRNLDAAVEAAYLDSPFLQRLRPPWIKMESSARRKRQADSSLGPNAFCLQSSEEKTKLIEDLKAQC